MCVLENVYCLIKINSRAFSMFFLVNFCCHCSDEELGGDNGMKLFVQTEAFKRLNVGFSLGKLIMLPNQKRTVSQDIRYIHSNTLLYFR